MTDTKNAATSDAPGEHHLHEDAMAAFAELGRINLGDADLHQVLSRVAELAKAVIPQVAAASVTLLVDGRTETAAFAGELASLLDERQYAEGQGPCLDAAKQRATYTVSDMATEHRWPALVAAALDAGVRSSLSVGIPVQEVVAGGLNLYSLEPDAFGSDAETLAETFANYAAVAIANAYLYSTTAALADQMSAAMASRAVIEQAKGIIMAQQGLDPDAAFQVLARASQTSNRKLRDIATAIVAGASSPQRRSRDSRSGPRQGNGHRPTGSSH